MNCAVTFSRVFKIRLKRNTQLIEQWPRSVSQQQALVKRLPKETLALHSLKKRDQAIIVTVYICLLYTSDAADE